MSRATEVGELQLEQDPTFQRRDWLVQRVGWALMLVVVLAAAGGLLGRGPAARATIGDAGAPIRIEYMRIIRHATAERLTMRLANVTGERRIVLDSAIVAALEIQRVVPAPIRMDGVAGGVAYTFGFAGPPGERAIVLDYASQRYGRQGGGITVQDQPPIRLSFFVLP